MPKDTIEDLNKELDPKDPWLKYSKNCNKAFEPIV
jgi:hypothetical protein